MTEGSSEIARVWDRTTAFERWFLVLTIAVGHFTWMYAEEPWNRWPGPMRYTVWVWLGVAVLSPVGFLIRGAASTRFLLWQAKAPEVEALADTNDATASVESTE